MNERMIQNLFRAWNLEAESLESSPQGTGFLWCQDLRPSSQILFFSLIKQDLLLVLGPGVLITVFTQRRILSFFQFVSHSHLTQIAHKGQNFSKSMFPTWFKSVILHLHKSPPALREERTALMVKGTAHGSDAIISFCLSFFLFAKSFLGSCCIIHWLTGSFQSHSPGKTWPTSWPRD